MEYYLISKHSIDLKMICLKLNNYLIRYKEIVMNKKVGILTITDYGNYGNRLQNYATQEVLKNSGFEVTTIKSRVGNQIEKSFSDKLKSLKITDLPKIISKRRENKKFSNIKDERYNKFVQFTKDYIAETSYTISEDSIPDDINEQFDYFVTGSDQVWNPNYRKGSGIDFLTFAYPEKRIALSPSFGIAKIPNEYQKKYIKMINEMNSLSVREEAGYEIIKRLTGREAEVLIDPTLMLNKQEWLEIAEKPHVVPNRKYILTYYLGSLSEQNQEFLNKIAKENDLEIVELHNITRSKRYYSIDPSEFLYLINNASLFCTDSFHGSIFSIIFEKPFVVFDRIENSTLKMSSRIDTLLKKFKLSDRHEVQCLTKTHDEIFDIDTSHIGDILAIEQKKYTDYIKKSMS